MRLLITNRLSTNPSHERQEFVIVVVLQVLFVVVILVLILVVQWLLLHLVSPGVDALGEAVKQRKILFLEDATSFLPFTLLSYIYDSKIKISHHNITIS